MTDPQAIRPAIVSTDKHRSPHAGSQRIQACWPRRALWLSLILLMALAIGYFYLRDNAPARQPIRFDLGHDIHASRESGLRQEGVDSRPIERPNIYTISLATSHLPRRWNIHARAIN